MISVHNFYRDINIIRRILEYCGVPADVTKDFNLEPDVGNLDDSAKLREMTNHMTVEYICGSGKNFLKYFGKKSSSRYNEHLGELFDRDLNLFRSLWDREKITFLIDVEYVSHLYPGEVYINTEKTFWKMEPLYRCLMDIFAEYKIKPMTVVTGQGYHFVFDVNSYVMKKNVPVSNTKTAKRLVELGHLEESIAGKYSHLPWYTKRKRVVEPDLGKAYDTVGKLLEYIIHKAIKRAPEYGCKIPLGIGDLVPGNANQELINLDLSTYTSPLFTRVMRTAFSIHDKHKSNPSTRHIPVHIAIPRYTPCNDNELTLDEVYFNRRHFRNSVNYASAITMNIPEYTEQVMTLIDEYTDSDLHQFHLDYDRTAQEDPQDWWRTYDTFNLTEIPPCLAHAVMQPNPYLLRPAQIQTLVRVLTGKNWWHPKHVAGLIRSKYEKEYAWELNWGKYDANRHASVWVRMYAGLLAVGLDNRVDQNCVSHQEKGLCTRPFCGYNLANYR